MRQSRQPCQKSVVLPAAQSSASCLRRWVAHKRKRPEDANSEQVWEELTAHASRDPRWDVVKLSLGAREADTELSVMRSSVFSTLHAPVAEARFAEENVVAAQQTVNVRRLEAIIDKLGLRGRLGRALLKIDTEGHDRAVLKGMTYIDEVALLQIELGAPALYEDAPTMTELLDHIGAPELPRSSSRR